MKDGKGYPKHLFVFAVALLGITGGLALLAAPPRSTGPGSLAVWDPTGPQPAPGGEFMALAAGGGQTLALKTDGTLYLSPPPPGSGLPPIPVALSGMRFKAVGSGRNHGLAIRLDNGEIETWGLDAARCVDPAPAPCMAPPGPFVAATGAGQFSVGLDTKGEVILWGGKGPTALGLQWDAVVGVGAPAGIKFKAIAARLRYTLALARDGNIYGWGADVNAGFPSGVFNSPKWTSDGAGHFIAPFSAANPYTAIAAGTGFMLALRADGSVVVWNPNGLVGAAPANVVFTHIAAGAAAPGIVMNTFAAGIDKSGQLHAWGPNGVVTAVPAGCYADVSAAALYMTALSCQELTNLSPGKLSIGLKNSDDQGTRFDLRTEVYKNNVMVDSGIARCIAGVTRNPVNALEVSVPFGPIPQVPYASGDVLSFKVLTRIGTNPDDTKCPGHNNAVGLRLYYNGLQRPSRFGAQLAPSPMADLFLHTSGATDFLDNTSPSAATAMFKDSLSINFSGGNIWKEVGTWSMTVRGN